MENMLRCNNIYLSIKKASILKGVSFSLEAGSITGLIGANGSGKTSLIRVLSQEYIPSQGNVIFKGKSLHYYTRNEFNRYVGTLSGEASLYPHLSIEANLIYLCLLYNLPRSFAYEILSIIGLQNDRLSLVRNISMGMRQRLGIGFAFIHKPEIILLDEPTNSLDQVGIKDIANLINLLNTEFGVTFLIVSHNFNFLSNISSNICILKNGSLSYESNLFLSNNQSIAELYDEHC